MELNLPDLSSFHIVNIEFGLNTFVPIDVKNFVRFISYHGRNEFRTDSDHPHSKKSSTYRKGNRNQYKIIKAYAKSVQFPEYTEGDVFRFEVKSKKSRYIKKLGIYSIEDLLLEQTYLTLGDQLYKEYKTVLLLDQDLDLSSLNENEKTLLLKLSNPLYWEKLLNLNRNTFQNNKKRYTKLLDKTGYNLLRETRKIMKDKIASLCCANSHILIK
ncbi:hypothetical protein [Christiangramia forsetii]|uniref:hypothetical protein n=1 Tax=Christiangramia forsetii TaxID=411153 RepID=UPI0011D25F8B|nr:hypothetical protein [Christiangramia forsetii]